MHILFLTDNFPPEVNAPATRTFEHARRWVERGARVTVITTVPNHPAGKIYPGYRNRLHSRETMAGIEVIRVWTFVTANEGVALRLVDFLSFMVSATIAGAFVRRPDIVVATSPQFFTAVAGWLVSSIKDRPFVFELRDIWPESVKAVGAMKGNAFIRLAERLEIFLYRRADRIIAVTNAFKRVLIQRGIDGSKITVVTNGVDLNRFRQCNDDPNLRKELGLEGRFVASYIGTHGMAHALETVVEAAALLEADPDAPPVSFVLLGEGAGKAAAVRRAVDLGTRSVLFRDPVSRDQVVRYWALSECTIIPLRNTALFQTVIPSKLFEAMAMGVPIILGVGGEAAEILQHSGAGITVTPEDAEGLAQAIVQLASNPALADSLSNAGTAAAHLYDRVALADDMLQALRDVATER